jgi:excinuclease ABC subunit B
VFFDCLVGVNLLREGIDLPEVALVAIMDADIESFLRDKRSLIQIMGRAARNTESKVLLYADKITLSMKAAIAESKRRRAIQQAYNEAHGITPASVKREVTKSITNLQKLIADASPLTKRAQKKEAAAASLANAQTRIAQLEQQMMEAAERLDFEIAIALRGEWQELKKALGE